MTRAPYQVRGCGTTVDGKRVFTGAYALTCTHGLPLETILFFLDGQGAVLDWLDYICGCIKDGHKITTVRSRILAAVGDVYGPVYRKGFAERFGEVLAQFQGML